MRDSETRLEATSGTNRDLRDIGRRVLEDRERQDAIARVEQAGTVAPDIGVDRPVLSDAEAAHFGAQLRCLEERVAAMPHIDALLESEGAQRSESRGFAGSLRNAERVELRLGNHSENEEHGAPAPRVPGPKRAARSVRDGQSDVTGAPTGPPT